MIILTDILNVVERPTINAKVSGRQEWNSTLRFDVLGRKVGTIRNIPTQRAKLHNLPISWDLPNLRLLESRVPARQAPREQLLHQAALDDLHLVDDRLGLLDGVVHRGEDGGNLALLGKRGQPKPYEGSGAAIQAWNPSGFVQLI